MAVSGTRRTPLVAGAALAAALLLTGCGGTDDEPRTGSPTSSEGPQVLQGGEPGEQADEVAEGEVPANEWSHDDVMFMQMMIPHHAQALEMSRLAPKRAADPRVRRMAERIEAAQGPEITMMAGWLDERGLEVPRAADDPAEYDHSAHGHTGMSGMLTETELAALATTQGRGFDRLYLSSMIRHHAGAVQMAQETAGEGTDVRVGELRDDVVSSQTVEIGRMRALLADL